MSGKQQNDYPDFHEDHCFDRTLLDAAIDLLETSREPRSELVPDEASVIGLPEELSENGIGEIEALRLLAPSSLSQAAQLHHPGYFAHMDPPTPAITWAAALWQAASNQNLLHPDAAPAARVLQTKVIDWLVPFFGMEGGHFTAGATLANFTAMWAARDIKGIKRVICSNRAHLSIKKSAHILGLAYEEIESDEMHCLRAQVAQNARDAMLVLTAGTVAVGAIDPVSKGNAAWLHVDAAWSGPLRFSADHAGLLGGVEHADSVGVSAHKWLFQPKGSALILFKDEQAAHEQMSYGGGYLAAPNIGLLGSAPASALPLAACLLAWGRRGVCERVESTMAKADELITLIKADDRFELWGPNISGIVVWRARGQDTRQLRNKVEDAWLSLVDLDGEVWLRCVAANPSADPQWVFDKVCSAL